MKNKKGDNIDTKAVFIALTKEKLILTNGEISKIKKNLWKRIVITLEECLKKINES